MLEELPRPCPADQHHGSPERPPTSIFFRFLASRMQTVSFPAVGTYRREMQISPSFSGCQVGQGADNQSLPSALYHSAGTWSQLQSPPNPAQHSVKAQPGTPRTRV